MNFLKNSTNNKRRVLWMEDNFSRSISIKKSQIDEIFSENFNQRKFWGFCYLICIKSISLRKCFHICGDKITLVEAIFGSASRRMYSRHQFSDLLPRDCACGVNYELCFHKSALASLNLRFVDAIVNFSLVSHTSILKFLRQ